MDSNHQRKLSQPLFQLSYPAVSHFRTHVGTFRTCLKRANQYVLDVSSHLSALSVYRDYTSFVRIGRPTMSFPTQVHGCKVYETNWLLTCGELGLYRLAYLKLFPYVCYGVSILQRVYHRAPLRRALVQPRKIRPV